MNTQTGHSKTDINPPRWELFPHVADMGVRGYGRTIEEAFSHAAEALTAVICDPTEVEVRTPVEIHCEAPDVESLLVDWLNALVYEMAVRQMVFCRFDVRVNIYFDSAALEATVWGNKSNASAISRRSKSRVPRIPNLKSIGMKTPAPGSHNVS